MNDKARNLSLADLQHELMQMPELQLQQQLQAFNISIYIFDQNYIDLEKLIKFLTVDPKSQSLTAIRNREKLSQIQIDIVRRLHNFVAAAQSLIDHTRRLYDKLYGEKGNFPDYNEVIQQVFIDDPLSQFVVKLRVYCQHYRIPEISFNILVKKTDTGFNEKKTVTLITDDLRAFDGWNAKAKEFIETSNDSINVIEVMSAYRDKVIHFYRWFQTRQDELHRTELERLRKKQEEFSLLFIEQKIDARLGDQDKRISLEEDVFSIILTSAELEGLEQIHPNATERAARAIEILNTHLSITSRLCEKIMQLYRSEFPP